MTNTVELGPIDNPNVTLEENNDGEPVLRHEPSGATFAYDSTAGNWSLTGGFGSLSVDRLSTDWVVDAGDYGAVQSAIDDASNNDIPIVMVPPGDYGTITIPSSVSVRSGVKFGGATFQEVTINENYAELVGANIDGNDPALTVDGAGFSWRVSNCRIGGSVDIGPTSQTRYGNLSNNFLNGNSITLGSNSDRNIIDGNTNISSITDNGTNTIGDNA